MYYSKIHVHKQVKCIKLIYTSFPTRRSSDLYQKQLSPMQLRLTFVPCMNISLLILLKIFNLQLHRSDMPVENNKIICQSSEGTTCKKIKSCCSRCIVATRYKAISSVGTTCKKIKNFHSKCIVATRNEAVSSNDIL